MRIRSLVQPRRSFVASALLLLAACSNAAQAATYTMIRDPNCGCCLKWADYFEKAADAEVNSVDMAEMAKIKTERGVPQQLWSCHTMEIEGYIIEGHVPADAIERLLRERPEDITGLAVPGMPVGSPGMEFENRIQPFDVIAFGPSGQSVFASYP